MKSMSAAEGGFDPCLRLAEPDIQPKRVKRRFFLENPRQKPGQSMYTIIGREHMTLGDMQFLKAVGIVPCDLGGPLIHVQPPTSPAEAPTLHLTEDDARWLQNLGVICDEYEPDFVPPRSLHEYLTKHPTGIRDAVEAVASEMGLAPPDGALDDLAQDIEKMFLDFLAGDLEDVVALYGFHRSLRPEGFSFHEYMKFRVWACVETVLKLDPPSGRS